MENHVLQISIQTVKGRPVEHSHLHRLLVGQILSLDGSALDDDLAFCVFLEP